MNDRNGKVELFLFFHQEFKLASKLQKFSTFTYARHEIAEITELRAQQLIAVPEFHISSSRCSSLNTSKAGGRLNTKKGGNRMCNCAHENVCLNEYSSSAIYFLSVQTKSYSRRIIVHKFELPNIPHPVQPLPFGTYIYASTNFSSL